MSNSLISPSPYIIKELFKSEQSTHHIADQIIPAYSLNTFAHHWFEAFKQDWITNNLVRGIGVIEGFSSTYNQVSKEIEVSAGRFSYSDFVREHSTSFSFSITEDGWYVFWVQFDELSTTSEIKYIYLSRETIWSAGDLFTESIQEILPDNSIILGFVVYEDGEVRLNNSLANESVIASVLHEGEGKGGKVSFAEDISTGISGSPLNFPTL